jgi:antitoxin PrlF
MGLEAIMTQTPTPISESTLTDRYQTTIPDAVRKVLGLNKRDKIRYTIEPDGRVVISRADTAENDPVLEKFLNLLARDIENNPQHLQAIDSDLVFRVKSLVADVEFDLDAPLDDRDE